MGTLLIRNGYVIDPAQKLSGHYDVLIEGTRILRVEPRVTERVDRVIEAKNLLVMPGIIDMHVHLRDPGQTEKEDIYTGCNAAVTGGVTSLLCMPNTRPAIDNRETIAYIQRLAQKAKAKIYICGAATKGLSGEELGDYAMYRELGVCAVSDDGRPVESAEQMEQVLLKAQQAGLRVVSHCEDLAIVNGGIIHKGSVSEDMQVRGIDRLSEDRITQREIELAERTGAPVHICHVSTKGSTELIRAAKKRGVPVTAETCPHYFAYTHEKLRSRDADYRMNPPLREPEDVAEIIRGIQDGTFDCIVTDHAPHTKREKMDFRKASNGTVGLETSLAAGIRFLVEPGHIKLERLVELMTFGPARVLGIEGGSLEPGMAADLALVDPKAFWTVLPERLQSKSKNSVFKFERLQGRVKYTLVNGEIVYVMRY